MPGHVVPGHVVPGHVVPGHVVLAAWCCFGVRWARVVAGVARRGAESSGFSAADPGAGGGGADALGSADRARLTCPELR